ncbi:hypothetical protein CMK11_04915 [Candidatus Poribacteria bacterium]|nr:hypothetical protein [Candidatus Poribacteria bacterium]
MKMSAPAIATARRRLRPTGAALLLVVLLAGCGSVADDPTAMDSMIAFGPVIPDDVVPPELMSVVPDVVGRMDVGPASLREGLAAEFSETVDVDRLTISAGGSSLGWVATVDGSTITLQAHPGNPVVAGTRYQVGGSVFDIAGNVIEVAFWFETSP